MTPMATFFTLTELQERLNATDRHNLRSKLVAKGCPFVELGREVLFATDSFVSWLHANEVTRQPKASETNDAVA